MRLPWPFSRRDDATGSEAGPGSDAAAPSPAAPAPSGTDRIAPPTGAWGSLPPIQRAVGEPPLVAPAAPFLEGVPGTHPLPPIVEPLGHDVTPIAPAGIVAAPVHAVPALTSSASLVPRPVQRRSGPDHADAGDPWPTTSAPDTPRAGPAGAVAETTAEPAAPAELPAAEPPRRLGIVPEAATAQPPERPLTRAEPRPAGAPLVVARRTETPAASTPQSHAAPSMRTSRPAAPADPVQRETAPLGGAPLVARSAIGASPAAAALDTGETATRTTPSAAVSRPRRIGLGAPLAASPNTAVPVSGGGPSAAPGRPAVTVARTPDGPTSKGPAAAPAEAGPPRGFRATAGAGPLRTTIRREAASSGREPGATSAIDDGRAADPLEPARSAPFPRPTLPVLRAIRPAGDDSHHDRADSGAPDVSHAELASGVGPGAREPALPLQPATSATTIAGPSRRPPETPPRRPLVGARRPIAVAPVQRTADGVAPPAHAGSAASGLEGGLPAPDGAPAPRSLATSAFRTSDADDATPAPWSGGTVSAVADPFASGPPRHSLQRAATGAGPSPGGLQPWAATTAPVLRTPPRPASLPLTQPAAAGPPGIVAATPGPVVQPLPQAAPVLAPTATAVVQRVDGAAPPAPTESEGHSESDLDDLARKLFGRFQNRLRAELIYEREAKGLSFDN